MDDHEYVSLVSREVAQQLRAGTKVGEHTAFKVELSAPRLDEQRDYRLAVEVETLEHPDVTFRFDRVILRANNREIEPETAAIIFCSNLIEDLHFHKKPVQPGTLVEL